MKRFVYVPVGMRDSEVPPVAEKLAAESRLSIRILDGVTVVLTAAVDDGIEAEEIKIISVPEINRTDHELTALVGFVYSVDITNEFVNFDTSTMMKVRDGVVEQVFKPRLREKHVVRFRVRFATPGVKMFSICNDSGEQYYESSCEVI